MVVEQPSTTIHLCPSVPNKSLYYLTLLYIYSSLFCSLPGPLAVPEHIDIA